MSDIDNGNSAGRPNPMGETPPDIDLAANRAASTVAITSSLTAIVTVVVILRLFTRTKVQHIRLEVDDWLSVASLVPIWGCLICTLIGTGYGLGRHIWALSPDDITHLFQIIFAWAFIYFLALLLIKLAVIALYRRIFAMIKPLYLCVFLALGYFLGFTASFFAACQPTSYFWNVAANPQAPGHCRVNIYSFGIVAAALNTSIDVLILLVPVRPVWKLQMRTLQKVLVLAIFSLGALVCIASIVRLLHLLPYTHTIDSTYHQCDIYIWSTVEVCVGAVCTCLPTLNPLLRRTLQFLNLRICGLFSRSPFVLRSASGSDSTAPGVTTRTRSRTETRVATETMATSGPGQWVQLR
ncbi:hypothetical protein BDW74DRAFT_101371 [Aspergillus multicolor]|uniref:uncharacterized protein n=1 Tax=Aspergillus multicolor TaxID=41759 RepID=UPI003CCDB55E